MTCAVEGCGRPPPYTRGWCQGHYQRWRKTGRVRADRPLPPPVERIDSARINEEGDRASATLEAHAAEAAEHAHALIDAMTDPEMAAECRDRQNRLQVALTPAEQAIRKACQAEFGIYEPTESAQARFIDRLKKEARTVPPRS